VTFRWPFLLWGLVLLVPALLAYVLLQRARAKAASRFVSPHLMPNLVPAQPGWRRHVPALFYVLGLACLLVAMARPQTALSIPRDRATVVLAMDASRSMEATDIEPTRLIAARRAATSFTGQIPPRFQVGVVSFAREARILSRPTTDRVAVRRALDSLEIGAGTAIGDAISQALTLRPREPGGRERAPTVVLLLSDGVNTTGESPMEAAARARRAGVRVHTIVLGGAGEATAPNGRAISAANHELLSLVADTTRGEFFSAPSQTDLAAVYRNLGRSIGTVRQQQEVTAAFVGGAAALLVLGAGLSLVWFNRFP
jgi:Ca-activated chloride channel homolog